MPPDPNNPSSPWPLCHMIRDGLLRSREVHWPIPGRVFFLLSPPHIAVRPHLNPVLRQYHTGCYSNKEESGSPALMGVLLLITRPPRHTPRLTMAACEP